MAIKHPDTFCIWPWVGLEVNADSTTRPCCAWNDSLADANGKVYSIIDDHIETIRCSPAMQELRSSLLNGQKHSKCNQCWSQEAVPDRSSLRLDTNRRFSKYTEVTDFTNDPAEFQSVGIAMGNICNLRCRICGPWASSVWTTDELKMMPKEQWTGTLEQKMLDVGQWPRKTKTFWDDVKLASDELTEVRLYGGEPFLTPRHTEVIQHLVDSGRSGQIDLIYNTNGTIFPEAAVELWKHFNKVELCVSIDNIGDKFNYERNPAVWEEVCVNLQKFEALQDSHDNIVVKCVTTVSVFNVLYLTDIAHWLEQRKFKAGVFWNILHVMECFCVARLRSEYKDSIRTRLESTMSDCPTIYDHELKNVIDFMYNQTGTQDDYNNLIQEISRIDKFRQQHLNDSHPELATLLGLNNLNA